MNWVKTVYQYFLVVLLLTLNQNVFSFYHVIEHNTIITNDIFGKTRFFIRTTSTRLKLAKQLRTINKNKLGLWVDDYPQKLRRKKQLHGREHMMGGQPGHHPPHTPSIFDTIYPINMIYIVYIISFLCTFN